MSWIRTYSGKHFNYACPSANDIDIVDIAQALSHLCRFAGHLPEFYSVAQHSVYVSQLVKPELALEALLHDATEAYCVDIPSPLKALLPDYQRMEKSVDQAVREKFSLPRKADYSIHVADLMMLATERHYLGLDDGTPWPCLEGVPLAGFEVYPIPPALARQLFLQRYCELTHQGEQQ